VTPESSLFRVPWPDHYGMVQVPRVCQAPLVTPNRS
jgi:hypothetical protein